LIELVIVLTLSLALLNVVVMAYLAGIRSFQYQMGSSDISYEAGRCLDQMTTDVRQSLKVFSAEAHRMSLWYNDPNLNGKLETVEVVSYSLSGSNLTRTSSKESRVLTTLASGLDFSYDNPSDPYLVTIGLSLKSGASAGSFEAKVKLMNR
jgi:Tfp pilus assembly protein PilW